MASLVTSSCTLRFVEHEFVDFFGMVSPLDEGGCSYTYSAYRDGMELVLTVFPIAGEIYAEVFREGVTQPIMSSRLRNCTHSRFVRLGTVQWLEIGRTPLPTHHVDAILSWGLRLAIDPHLRIEPINEEGIQAGASNGG
jgi:hypothetical protein